MREFSRSLRTKLLFLVALAVTPAILAILHMGHRAVVHAKEDAGRECFRILDTVVARQQLAVESARQILLTLAAVPSVYNGNIVESEALFRALLQENEAFVNVFLADTTGAMIASAVRLDKPINVSDRRYFNEAMAARDFSVGEYTVARVSPQPSLHFAYPVIGETGKVRFVLGIAVNLRSYAKLFESTPVPSVATIIFSDWRGKILFTHPSNPDRLGKEDLGLKTARENEGRAYSDQGSAGQRGIFAYRALRIKAGDDPYLFVRVGISEQIALAEARRVFSQSLWTVIVASLLALLVAWSWGNISITGPVRKLVAAAEQIEAGDFAARVTMMPSSSELSRLKHALNKMAASLEARQNEHEASERSIRKSLEEKEVLLSEVHHRVKNNLQSIMALIEMQRRTHPSPSDQNMLKDLQGRIRAMALVHENLLETSHIDKIQMQEYLARLVERIVSLFGAETSTSIHVAADRVFLRFDLALACGLICNELVTNSLKYAFRPGQQDASIQITMEVNDNRGKLLVRDNGVGLPLDTSPELSKSLGLQLVRILTSNQLSGSMTYHTDDGAVFDISFPTERE